MTQESFSADPPLLLLHGYFLCRPYLWGEAGREAEGERRKLGWLHWEPPGLRQVLESLDSARMSLSLNHFPQLASLEVCTL